METKKSKCTVFEPLEPMGKAKPANVTFENGERHFTFSEFKVGQEYEYYIETRQKKSGDGTYDVCCKKKDEASYGGKRYFWNDDHEGKVVSMGISFAKDLYADEKIGELGFSKIHEIVVPTMQKALDTCTTDRHKNYVTYAMSYAVQMVVDEGIRKKMLAGFKEQGDPSPTSLMEMVVRTFEGILKAKKGYDRGK